MKMRDGVLFDSERMSNKSNTDHNASSSSLNLSMTSGRNKKGRKNHFFVDDLGILCKLNFSSID